MDRVEPNGEGFRGAVALTESSRDIPRSEHRVPDTLELLKTVIGHRYTIQRELGSGGMATVYLAEDRKHRRLVALKVFRPEPPNAPGTHRFLREIEFLAQLTHPHILPLHDSGEVNGLPYYVMPYVGGGSVRDRLNQERRFPIDQALRIAQEVAAALHFAHGNDLVHRDIKPENILLANGHAVVADFGIAHAICTSCPDSLGAVLVGTPAYMSPEQATDDDVDPRSDIYSLACVLYEMLTGEVPYVAKGVMNTVVRHVSDPIPSVRKLRPHVPVEVDAAIAKALAKRPVDRFPTAAVFADVLAAAVPAKMALTMGQPTG